MEKIDYYRVLGVKREASAQQIKNAYRKQAKMHHPDAHTGKSPEEQNAHAQQMQRVNEAYEVLSDPEERAYYDAHGVSRKQREQASKEPMTPIEERILNLFTSVFNPLEQDPRREKYATMMRQMAERSRREASNEVNRMKSAIEKIGLLKGRMTRKKQTSELFEGLITDQVRRAEAVLSEKEKELQLWVDVCGELKEWEYRTDEQVGAMAMGLTFRVDTDRIGGLGTLGGVSTW